MPCYSPLTGYRKGTGGITFGALNKGTGMPMKLPCGRCIGCRLERSRQWAVRMMHEAQLHEENCFLTLTYDDEHLPEHGSLDKEAFPRFMKRLRKTGINARYFHCGEYGENTMRPHYHACLFGHAFPDKTKWAVRNGNPVWRSTTLERLWPYGNSEIGSLTFESAAYVARYVTKKVTGRDADTHYERLDPSTGELVQLTPEFATMSRRPGIGSGWLDRFITDVYPSDEVVANGHPSKPPRYYDERLRSTDPDQFEGIRRNRHLRRNRDDETPERLAVRETCTKARLNLNPRGL